MNSKNQSQGKELTFGDVKHYYENFYSKAIGHNSSGLLKLLAQYPHVLMEKKKNNKDLKILEIGGGSGEHFRYVEDNFKNYTIIDLNKKSIDLANIKYKSDKFEALVMDAEKLTFPDEAFDRIIATCVLAHLKNPEKALNEWKRVLAPAGQLTIYVPCEPGLLLQLFRLLISRPIAYRRGFRGYKLFIARDHINSASNLIQFLKYVFESDKLNSKFRPFAIKSWRMNLFIIFEITKH